MTMNKIYRKEFNINSSLANRTIQYLNESSMLSSGSNLNSNYVSHLPDVYSGAPNRVERYNQYEAMDLDSHISVSLDIIAEFCTQVDPLTNIPFKINYAGKPTETESEVVSQMLRAWTNTNDFDNQLFDIFRDVLKFGDQFYIRDPETSKWIRIYHANVEKVIVNESKGKKPEQYVVKDLDLNLQNLSATQIPNVYSGNLPSVPGNTFNNISYNTKSTQSGKSFGNSRFNNAPGSMPVDAEHIIHVNMSKRGDPTWPFGSSILEKVFKSYKQKELLEDSILIYRIQRAPQRRIFYIDVGDLPDAKAMAFVEQVKNSVSQRRIPSKNGGGSNVLDAAYNPISILDDFFFPQKPEGRGSKIDTLPGGETSWGIDELNYFDNKLARGLRVPSSYLPTGPDDSAAAYTDGHTTTALIQEYRFSEYCKRIQRSISKIFDEEFKLYLKKRDCNIDSSLFSLGFVEPQSFVTWRQIELDTSRIGNFSNVVQNAYFSKRFAMERFLGLTQDEINKNHDMLMEENPTKFEKVANIDKIVNNDVPVDLRNIGFNKHDFDDTINDSDNLEQPIGDENIDNVINQPAAFPETPSAPEGPA